MNRRRQPEKRDNCETDTEDTTDEVTSECESFIRLTYSHTSYEEEFRDGAKQLFSTLMRGCQELEGDDAKAVIAKFEPLAAMTTSQRAQYRAMIKVAWRFVKGLSGDRRLLLLCVAFSALTVGARRSGASPVRVDKWRDEIAKWFGEQLTIGGQGVTGDGEGSAFDRADRFFNTPYLHDFD